ncbi:hypothetical protein SAMN05192558_1058 [Actinokineospora alba]|uniref:Uncharacterized protein n=1 Tax=Actinokineospora alba TaxID=504798 RepID=A0A1H0MPR7_9PSEU|nr:hypothetical protein SAMN05192558_1058 [Actinokineospora alba]
MTAAPRGAPRADAPATTGGSVIVSTPSPTPPPAARGLGALTAVSHTSPKGGAVVPVSGRSGRGSGAVAPDAHRSSVEPGVGAAALGARGPSRARGVGDVVSGSAGLLVARGAVSGSLGRWLACGVGAEASGSAGSLVARGAVSGSLGRWLACGVGAEASGSAGSLVARGAVSGSLGRWLACGVGAEASGSAGSLVARGAVSGSLGRWLACGVGAEASGSAGSLVACGVRAVMAGSSGPLVGRASGDVVPAGELSGLTARIGVRGRFGREVASRSGERCRRLRAEEVILGRCFGTAWGGRAGGFGAAIGDRTSGDGFGCSVSGLSRGGVVDRAVGATQGGGG